MSRKLIIDGNAVYEIDEECMLKKRIGREKETKKDQEGHKEKNSVREEWHGGQGCY